MGDEVTNGPTTDQEVPDLYALERAMIVAQLDLGRLMVMHNEKILELHDAGAAIRKATADGAPQEELNALTQVASTVGEETTAANQAVESAFQVHQDTRLAYFTAKLTKFREDDDAVMETVLTIIVGMDHGPDPARKRKRGWFGRG